MQIVSSSKTILNEVDLKAQKEILRRRSEAGFLHKEKRVEQKRAYHKAANETFNELTSDHREIMPVCQKTSDGSILFVGKIENEIYKIVLNEKNSRFYAVHRRKLFPLAPESVISIFKQLDQKLNQSGELDEVLSALPFQYKMFMRYIENRKAKRFPIKVSAGHVVTSHRKQICRLLAPQLFQKYIREV